MEFVAEDILQVGLALDLAVRQVLELGPGGVGQTEWEVLNDEILIVGLSCSIGQLVVLEPYSGVGGTSVPGDMRRRSKAWAEGRITDPSPEGLRFGPVGARAPTVLVVVACPLLLGDLGLLASVPPGIDRVACILLLTHSVVYQRGRGMMTRSRSAITLSQASRGTRPSRGSVIPKAGVTSPAP